MSELVGTSVAAAATYSSSYSVIGFLFCVLRRVVWYFFTVFIGCSERQLLAILNIFL